jgi:plasmid stabilization system protein ParE
VRPVEWSRAALHDFERLIAYIASRNPIAATRVTERIDRTGRLLGEMATGRPGRVTGTYEKPVPGLPYIIAYRLVPLPDGTEKLVILRIIHGARKWLPEEWPD